MKKGIIPGDKFDGKGYEALKYIEGLVVKEKGSDVDSVFLTLLIAELEILLLKNEWVCKNDYEKNN